VTGTFILNTTLFLAVSRSQWHTRRWKLIGLGALFLIVEVAFFTSNLAKVAHGAWLSLGVGLVISFVMITWQRGRIILTRNRTEQEGSLPEFLDGLRAEVAHNHALHEKVVIVSVDPVGMSHVDDEDRFCVEWLGRGLFKIAHVTIRVGYQDASDIPAALAGARKRGLLERNLDLEHASYFVSKITITATDAPGMRRWRKALFIAMARNASSPIAHFRLPADRTVMMGSEVGF
jgi:KUP system potassium uptake protein